MNVKHLIAALAGFTIAFIVSCGASSPQACNDYANVSSTLKTKWATCDAGAGRSPVDSLTTSCSAAVCTNAYNQCSAADQAVMNTFIACITKASTCTPGNEQPWSRTLVDCFGDAGTPSAACQAAFNDAGC